MRFVFCFLGRHKKLREIVRRFDSFQWGYLGMSYGGKYPPGCVTSNNFCSLLVDASHIAAVPNVTPVTHKEQLREKEIEREKEANHGSQEADF